MKKLLVLIAVALAAFLNAGCSTLADAKAARGSGVSKTYDQPYDAVWDAVLASVKESGLDLVSGDKGTGTVLAQRGMTAFSYGENVAVFVDRVDGKVSTRVEVVNKRTLATNITAADWSTRLFATLDKKLAPH